MLAMVQPGAWGYVANSRATACLSQRQRLEYSDQISKMNAVDISISVHKTH